jgi:hypothetical protein
MCVNGAFSTSSSTMPEPPCLPRPRLWFAFFVFRARRVNGAPSKSIRNAIAASIVTSPNSQHRVRSSPPWESHVSQPLRCLVLDGGGAAAFRTPGHCMTQPTHA